VFTGTNEFDGAVDLGSAAVAATAAVGDSDTSVATTAFVQAAVGKVYIQKFTSVPTTVTVTAATPAVMSWASHGLAIGQAFQVATSGTLPAGMALLTTYFVITAGFGANSFQFSLTRGGAAINTTTTGTGTHTATPFYVPSTGMVKAIGETLGAGAGGAGTANSAAGSTAYGGGGGGGGYSRKLIAAADVAAAGLAVTIGAGGTGGASGSNNGLAGGDTSIGAICVGKGASPGTVSAGTGTGGAGGVVGTGDITVPGEAGSSATSTSIISGITSPDGGRSLWGGRGVATPGGAIAGPAATGFGAGGGGAMSRNAGGAAAGGNGAPGLVIITEFCNQ
jgi:hypothetical protein